MPLYGAFPVVTGAVPTSADEIRFMATDGVRLPTVSTTVKLGTNATNSNTNKPNKDHPVPFRATLGHTKYHQKASNFDLHTPRTKAAEASRSEIVTAIMHIKAGGRAVEILVTTAPRAVKAAPAARRYAIDEP